MQTSVSQCVCVSFSLCVFISTVIISLLHSHSFSPRWVDGPCVYFESSEVPQRAPLIFHGHELCDAFIVLSVYTGATAVAPTASALVMRNSQ